MTENDFGKEALVSDSSKEVPQEHGSSQDVLDQNTLTQNALMGFKKELLGESVKPITTEYLNQVERLHPLT